MQIQQIRSIIQSAVDDEERTGRCKASLRTFARANGANPTEAEVDGVVKCIREYIGIVPNFLMQAAAEGRTTGLSAEIAALIAQIEAYWLEENDLIPDHFGLVGVLDDAYASLTLLQALSDICKSQGGRGLITEDLTEANRAMRQVLGEPTASILDQDINNAIGQVTAGQWMNQLMQANFMLGPMPSTTYGGTTMDDYVNTQLGAMGVF